MFSKQASRKLLYIYAFIAIIGSFAFTEVVTDSKYSGVLWLLESSIVILLGIFCTRSFRKQKANARKMTNAGTEPESPANGNASTEQNH